MYTSQIAFDCIILNLLQFFTVDSDSFVRFTWFLISYKMSFFAGERFNFRDHVSFLRDYLLIYSKKCNISCYVNIIPPLGRDAALCHVLEISRFNFFFKKCNAPSILFTLQLGIFMMSSYIIFSLLTSYYTSIVRYFSFNI